MSGGSQVSCDMAQSIEPFRRASALTSPVLHVHGATWMTVFGAGAPSGTGVSPGHAGDPGVDAVVGLHSHHDGSLRGRSRHARARDGAAPAANSAPIARRARRSTARARRGLRAPARDRGRPATLDDPLRPTRRREDDARAHRRRDHRRRVRGALRRFGARRRRPRRAPAGTRPARSQLRPGRSCFSTRSTASTRASRTRSYPASRAGC